MPRRRLIQRSDHLKAVIFSSGQTFNLAKSVKYFSKELRDYQIDLLIKSNVVDRIIVVDPERESNQYLGKVNLVYVQNRTPRIDLRVARRWLDDQPFLLLLGNVLTDYSLVTLRGIHLDHKADISLLYDRHEPAQRYIKMNERKNVTDIRLEQGKGFQALSDACLINPELLTYLEERNSYFYEKFIPDMLHRGRKLIGVENNGFAQYVETPEDIYKGTFELLKKEIFLLPGTKINNSYYGEKCEIEFSVNLEGKQFFGDNCYIANNSLCSNNIIYNNVKIGKQCQIKNSLIMDDVSIGDNCEIGDALIGEGVIIEDNVRVPNRAIITRNSKLNQYSGVLNV